MVYGALYSFKREQYLLRPAVTTIFTEVYCLELCGESINIRVNKTQTLGTSVIKYPFIRAACIYSLTYLKLSIQYLKYL